jgi:hypothetical protein
MPKTLFLFILRHPEGVMLHDLDNYRTEIHNLYLSLSRYSDLSKVRDSVKQLTDVANFVSETPMFVALKRIWLKRLPMNRLRVTELRAKETKRIAFGNDFIDFESGGYRK